MWGLAGFALGQLSLLPVVLILIPPTPTDLVRGVDGNFESRFDFFTGDRLILGAE